MTPQATEPVVETTPPNGIKGLADAESWWTPEHVLMVALPVALVLMTGWLALIWLGRNKSAKKAQERPVDPWTALGQQIESLAMPTEETTETASSWTQFASEVSLSARHVLADATGLPCDDWTTDECAVKLQQWGAPDGLVLSDVLALLRETDMVRFAERRPPSAASQWRDQVKTWYRIRDQQRQMTASIPSSAKSRSKAKKDDVPPPPLSPPSADGGLRVFD